MPEGIIFEQPVLWSRVVDAVRFWGSNGPDLIPQGDETSCVVPIHADLKVKLMRDWLAHEFGSSYEMFGIGLDEGTVKRDFVYPHGLRFRFPQFDDKLLFALRWL